MSSTKSFTGHLIGAAGAIETIFCIKGMKNKVIPATLNLHTPDPECDLNYVPNKHLTDHSYDVAMNISFGFGGTNAGVMGRKHAI
jgi:3-oxoacyl-[acyl-carrier-protein] synthase II